MSENVHPQAELRPGMYHPAAFYVPSAPQTPTQTHKQQLSPNELQDYDIQHGDAPQGGPTAVLTVLIFCVGLVYWLWQQR